MLSLVVADRNDVGLVEQDVAGHQHRVGEQPRRDEVLAVGLLLELRHAAQLAVARDSRQQPSRLGVRRHVALGEHRRPLGVEPGRDQHRVEVERAGVQVGRVVVGRDRVEVDDAEERVAALLGGRVLAEATDQVAEMFLAGRLDAGEDAHWSPFAHVRGREARFPATQIGLAWFAQTRQNKVRRWSEDIVLHF